MAHIILVTSFKGGVGKTTVSAGLAMTLAERSEKVLACDADLESRCLDLVAGLDDLPLFNLCDVVKGTSPLDSALVADPRFPSLSYITAPAFYPEAIADKDTSDIFTAEAVSAFLDEAAKQFDYILFDLPARPDRLYRVLARCASTVLIVSFPTATSIRAAEKTAIAIGELRAGLPEADVRLIVNAFRPSDVKSGDSAGLYNILERAKVPLIGVIPYDSAMMREQEKGVPAAASRKPLIFNKAMHNIVDRLSGKNVRLLAGIRTRVKNKDLF